MAYLTHILEQEDGVLFRGFVIRNTKGEVLAPGAGNISLQHQLFIFFSRTRISPYLIKEKFGTLQAPEANGEIP